MEDERYAAINHIVAKGDILLAVGVVAVLGGLIIPLPPFIIDVMLAFNIGIAMIIIMVANFVEKPLDFSVFPSILLFTALLRIGMNVATTRKILLEAYAGEIIDAFGEFVVGGNFIVGVIIFIILYVIQTKVIVAGSSRISEVAARFTLDAMPGKQMTIDADLNSGLISEEEARDKRDNLAREADFYGAMDGAAKFVRGDVTAGMIITAINIVGGLCIGMFMQGMEFYEALSKYTLLTVGDGLVAQVPSLVIAVASGIIVTRAGSSKDSLGKEITGQMLIHPKATGIGAGTLLLAGIIPKMPLIPFWSIGLAWAGISWYVSQRKKEVRVESERKVDQEKVQPSGPEPVDELLHVDIMGLEIGYGLISLVDSSQGGDFLERINSIRRRFAMDLGLVVPPIRIRDNMELQPNEYVIKIKGNPIARGEVMPDSFLAMNAGGLQDELVGIQTKEPAFGLPATWVNETEKTRAESLGFTVVDAASVLATHLTEITRKYGYELLTRQDVQAMVDNLKKRYPAVVEEVIPAKIGIGQVHRVLQHLLREQVSIRNLVTIFEVVGDYAAHIKDMEVMTEYVRAHLKMEISRAHATQSGELYVLTMDPKLEQQMISAINRTELGTSLVLEPALKSEVMDQIAKGVGKASESGVTPVLLVSPQIRIYLRKMIEKELPSVPVMSYSEVADNVTVHSLGMIALQTAGAAR